MGTVQELETFYKKAKTQASSISQYFRSFVTASHQMLSGNSTETQRPDNKECIVKGKQNKVQLQKNDISNKKEMKTLNEGRDNEYDDDVIKKGDKLLGRYELNKLLGRGSYGHVLKAYDLEEQCHVAIKFIKNTQPFINKTEREIKLLELLNRADPQNKNFIVRLKGHFMLRNYSCLVFELLSLNLYEVLERNDNKGLNLNTIRKYAQQLCKALDFLSSPGLQVIHCDLKPDNILVSSTLESDIKIVDFGNSCQLGQRFYKYVQAGAYRAPEILLGLEYDLAIDMWSLGCILVELYTGQPLFVGTGERDHLNKIIEVLGMPPQHLLAKAPKAGKYFHYRPSIRTYVLKEPKDDKKYGSPGSRKLRDILGVYDGGLEGRQLDKSSHSFSDYDKFVDLITEMLSFDPETRITPNFALQKPFFQKASDEGANTPCPNPVHCSEIILKSSRV